MAEQKERMLDIVLTRNVAIEGKHVEAGSKVRVTENLARYLVGKGKASWPEGKEKAVVGPGEKRG